MALLTGQIKGAREFAFGIVFNLWVRVGGDVCVASCAFYANLAVHRGVQGVGGYV